MIQKKRILLGLGCFIAIAVVSGAVFEAVTRQQVAKKYPAMGKLIDIGDRKIQLDCRGSGSPTVVLESGLDNLGSLSWAKVHDEIAQTSRVCAYSRAGIMWSDPAPDKAPPIVKEVGGAYIPPTAGSNLNAMQSRENTLATASKFRQLGNRPLVVLTAMPKIDPEKLKSAGIGEEQGKKFQAAWKELHDDETTWSSHSRHEVLTDSDHYIQFDRPDAVIKAVREVITDVRKTSK